MSITSTELEALLGVLKNIDWADATEAVMSGFKNLPADEALAANLFETLAPILAPYIIAAVGLEAVPFLGLLTPLLLPAIALAASQYKGGGTGANIGPDKPHSGRRAG